MRKAIPKNERPMKISLESLVVSVKEASPSIDLELHARIASLAGVSKSDVEGYKIIKRSVDARKKPDVKILYKLVASLRDGAKPSLKVEPAQVDETPWMPPEKTASGAMKNPIIVGSGPAGLFAALVLAEAGANPIVVERGYDVERRKADIDGFFKTRILNTESNLLFGEGGAGTWSDGKLFTRVRDPRIRYVLESMVEAGAQEEILYFSHPHIGSDKLPEVVAGIRLKIEALGGKFLWGTKVESIISDGQTCKGVKTSTGEKLEAPATIIACGHSARELILSLIEAGAPHSAKGFQIGCRIEHPQEFVNFIQYGSRQAPPALGAADYNFSSKPSLDGRFQGATSFCMCPGGEIIPCVSDLNQLSTNGMSKAARAGRFANAAIVSAIHSEFRDAKEAFDFLRKIEEAAFTAGGCDYTAPAQAAASFIYGELGGLPSASSYALGLKPAKLQGILPRDTYDALSRALCHFDKMAPGFVKYGTLVGVETRVSSPVRFDRKPNSMESGIKGLYLVGEGAGMAGGITSAAVDGIRAAEELASLTP